jgi:hypothetical protein
MKVIGLLLIAAVTLFSCKKAENRTCFKSWGKETTLEIPLTDNFDRLYVEAHIEVELIQDSTDKLVIIGGENVVNLIDWKIEDKLLTLKNKNKCNFLRNERKVIKVEIHYTNIFNIRFEGTEPMTSRGEMKTDYFVLFIRDGAGPVDLSLNCISAEANISHGWGNYTLRGKTQYAVIGVNSNGYCDTRDLIVSDSIYVSNNSSGDIQVNVGNLPLNGFIRSNGNIKYLGQPVSNNIVISGAGKLIDLD